MKVGLISDTHGVLRQEVIAHLKTCELILHAGDIGEPEMITTLEEIAPLIVVKGNNDKGQWAEALPAFKAFNLENWRFYMVHQKKDLPKDLSAIDIAIIGHSHRYSDTFQEHTRLINPGSCGKRRFDLPITMAILTLSKEQLHIEPIPLDPTKN